MREEEEEVVAVEKQRLLGFGADNKKIMCYATPIAQGPIY
jgi:hypothetical protein